MSKVKLAPARTTTVQVQGADVVMLVNPPISLVADLESGSGDRLIRALETIVVSHEFVSDDDSPAVVRQFDSDLAREIANKWAEVMRALPPASAPTSSPAT